ncbi:Extracellular matrix-binding ebh, putative [Babesia ovata]|uniref:Extracellular matrix-binding ebh, putative n=1 Tax=Babesia ovata TaxID=189622 RepID=A0A2H6KC86_9APIC|nr:Extracellular matrix-binding ebh, putative [Babesia ovata]GBE60569.1 Extracellular matrix-binding ebh, putative [Babesia ovata]
MDGDLKMDLYKVREEIKTQIGSALKSINVLTLDELVKGDMKTLKERISDVTKDVGKDTKSSGLLQNELFKLDEARNTFNQNTVTPIQNAEKGLEVKFKEQIQEKLSAAVSEVDRAIQTLGGKFSQNDKKLQPIFEHIKKQVAEIKGNGGEWDNRGTWKTPGSGLDGIRTKVQKYVDAFSGWQFGSRITGWTEDILKHNGVVRPMIGRKFAYDHEGEKEGFTNVSHKIKEQLEIDADTAGQEVQQRNNGAGGDIVKNISAVQAGCEHFADKLDERMKNSLSDTVEGVRRQLFEHSLRAKICVCESVGCKNCKNCSDEFCKKNSVLAAILCALSATVRQVGNELNSVLLEPPDTNIASILDTITPIASDLSDKLTQATEKSGSPPVSQGQPPRPSRGHCDRRSEEFRGRKKCVINNLKTQVGLLPTAVEAFDGVAKAQIKAAAKAAITAAAEQISDARGTIELGGKNNLMDTFNKQFTTIKSSLEGNIKKEVDDHIGQDDQTGGQGGDQKVELEKGKFPHYEKHVTQPVELDKTLTGKADDGHLPAAIGDIKTVGLAALEKHIGDKPTEKIDNETFTGPFKAIKTELDEIKKLVDGEDGMVLFDIAHMSKKGAKTLLTELSKLLTNPGSYTFTVDGSSYQTVQGLEAIKKAIDGLQTGTFKQQPAAIEKAVQEIRTQLKDLREKLKKENGEDVILTLTELQNKGLEKEDWQNGKGQSLSGLGKIENNLQKENDELPVQTKIIDKAIRKIQVELANVRIDMNNVFNPFDVIDRLQWLKVRIGQGMNVGLQRIQRTINELQEKPFQQHPDAIGKANSAIKAELTTLRGELQGSKPGDDVIETLNDLQNNGLGSKYWIVDKKGNKGLKNIQDALQGQQTTLSSQPTEIGGGVDQITSELDRLRGTLKKEIGYLI